ncbi:MAG: hypothetical protein RL514_18 [Verrucomicrobiota bacterium]|jgi:signal transduction histidine kinase/DNA-binding response OmpR family regulator
MIKAFRDLPIRRKLTLGIAATSFIPLLIAGLLVITYGFVNQRSAAVRDLKGLCETLAVGARVQLEFKDPQRAAETLATLAGRPQIMAAALFTPDGKQFATYTRAGLTGVQFPTQLVAGHHFTLDTLDYLHPIGTAEDLAGHLFVQSDLQMLYAPLPRIALIVGGVMAGLLAVTWWLSGQFESAISRPLLALAGAAQKVQTSRDYSVRATKEGEDEIGQLTDAFNQMLTGIEEAARALNCVNASLHGEVEQRERVEEALRHLNETLEQRVADRTAAAEAASRTKSEFLANMSHELRTPLNSVIGFGNILLKNKAGNLRAEDVAFLDRILANGKHLLGLINEILDLSKIEARKVELVLAPVALEQLVTEIIATQEVQLRGRPVKLLMELPPKVAPLQTDATRLKQVLLNLVGNALKFTETGNVTVRLLVHPKTLRPRRLEVADTGIGIPLDRQAAVFEAFQQADSSTSRKFGGTGLGLTISRALCELLGCRLGLQSELGRGTTFSITFPVVDGVVLQSAKKKAAGDTTFLPRLYPSKSPAPKRLSGPRLVLVIDDEEDSRDLLADLLEECGCQAITADAGQRALVDARKLKPDLILLDLMMPSMNGWQVLQALKADAELKHIPVVIASIVARENQGTIIGAVDLLQKPIAREDLLRVLGTRLRPKVLVVEDNDFDQQVFASGLAAEGVEYRMVSTGREALAAVEQFNPDLILLDLLLPEMDGMEFLQHLRQNPLHEHLPVFIVTAKELSADETELLHQQARVIFRKSGDLAVDFKRFLTHSVFPALPTAAQPPAPPINGTTPNPA